MTFIPTQTVQNAFEVCGGFLPCFGEETSRNSLPGSSLLDIADWEACEAARQNMMPRLSLSSPAPRYGVLVLNPTGGR